MQYLIGLDEAYVPVRSLILTTKPLPDVKSSFATMSRDESHKKSHVNVGTCKTGPSASAAKFFELVGYPPGFKRKGVNQSVNNVIPNKVDHIKGDLDSASSTSTCEVCHMEKQIREPFPLREHKTMSLGDIIHLNVWGPYKVTSREGYRYFPTAVDDYTRDVKFYGTMYPFKNSSLSKDFVLEENGLNFFDNETDVSEKTKSYESYDDLRERNSENSNGNVIKEKDIPFIQQEGLVLGDSRTDKLGGISTSKDISNDSGTLSDDHENISENKDFGIFGDMFRLDESARFADTQSVINERIDQVDERRSLNKIIEHKTYLEAVKDHRWVEAMHLEMEALNRNMTWVITELPVSRKLIGCKWVFKVKYKSNGSIKRFKARLVAKGYNQKERIDHEKTFSPIIKIVTVRCIISLAVSNNLPMFQLDINNAFLYGKLVEDVYMKLPKVHYLSQMMHSPMHSHLKLALRVLRYLKESPGKGITFEKNLKVQAEVHVEMSCDNSSAMQIAANHVLHERTKHFEIDLFFLREKIAEGIIKTVKVKSEENVADIFTKGLSIVDHKRICHKLRLKDLFQS
nr:hypothetical protein [Tanacetum cinerariifolium]